MIQRFNKIQKKTQSCIYKGIVGGNKKITSKAARMF